MVQLLYSLHLKILNACPCSSVGIEQRISNPLVAGSSPARDVRRYLCMT